jgi:hypothetical protein
MSPPLSSCLRGDLIKSGAGDVGVIDTDEWRPTFEPLPDLPSL